MSAVVALILAALCVAAATVAMAARTDRVGLGAAVTSAALLACCLLVAL